MKTCLAKYYLWIALAAMTVMSACGVHESSQKAFESAAESGKPLLKIGGYDVREGYLGVIGKMNPQLKAQIDSPVGRKKLLDTITEQELLYQGSVKKGFDRDSSVLQKIGLYSRVIIAQAMVEKELEKRVKEYYDAHQKDEFEQMQISDIFVKTDAGSAKEEKPQEAPAKAAKPAEAKASPEELKKKATDTLKAVEDQLKKGADFGALVAQYSDDALIKKKGGDLGWVSRSDKRMERKDWRPLLERAFSLKVGDVSDIIETKDGLHIIKVVAGPKTVPLEEAQNAIRLKVGTTVKKDVLDALKKDIKVVNLEAPASDSKPPLVPTPPPPPAVAQPGSVPPPPHAAQMPPQTTMPGEND